jgi:Ca2+-binding EF-hand superfamily protein
VDFHFPCGLSSVAIFAVDVLTNTQFSDAFGKVLESSGGKLEGLQIERLFMQIDANSDGGVDWNEFSNYMLLESQANQSEPTEHVVSIQH